MNLEESRKRKYCVVVDLTGESDDEAPVPKSAMQAAATRHDVKKKRIDPTTSFIEKAATEQRLLEQDVLAHECKVTKINNNGGALPTVVRHVVVRSEFIRCDCPGRFHYVLHRVSVIGAWP